jgi:hypothetical protein
MEKIVKTQAKLAKNAILKLLEVQACTSRARRKKNE